MEIAWPLVLFSMIAGAGGSALAVTALSEFLGFAPKARRNVIIVSLVMVVVGGTCSLFHLEQKANLMAAAANIFSFSPISVELIMVGLTFIFGLVYLICVVKEAGAGACKLFAALSLVAGLLLGYVTGAGYQMGAQPHWNTVLLPLAYLGTSLALGSALYVALALAFKGEGELGIQPLALATGGGAVALVLCAAYAAVAGAGVQVSAVIAVVASACACACGALQYKKGPSAASAWAGVVLALIAALAIRIFMWVIGTGTLDLFTAAAEHAVL